MDSPGYVVPGELLAGTEACERDDRRYVLNQELAVSLAGVDGVGRIEKILCRDLAEEHFDPGGANLPGH